MDTWGCVMASRGIVAKNAVKTQETGGKRALLKTVCHYPIHPFGKFARRYRIEMSCSAEAEPVPLSRTTLAEPLTRQDKDLLEVYGCWIEGVGTPEPDYDTLRIHLETVCRVPASHLSGLTWRGIMEILRERAGGNHRIRKPPALQDDDHLILLIFEERGTLTKNGTIERIMMEKGHRRSLTTIKRIVCRLLKAGLIERSGERSGACITAAGRARLASL